MDKRVTFSMPCGCKFVLDADEKSSAKNKFKEMMVEEVARAHYSDKHPGVQMPPFEVVIAGVTLTSEDIPRPEENEEFKEF